MLGTFRVLKRVVVRRYVSLESPKVATLYPDEVVDCVDEQLHEGRTRCRVFLGSRDGYGWVSAQRPDSTPLLEQQGGDDASPVSGAGERSSGGLALTSSAAARTVTPRDRSEPPSAADDAREDSDPDSNSDAESDSGGGAAGGKTFAAAMAFRNARNLSAGAEKPAKDARAMMAEAFDGWYHVVRFFLHSRPIFD